VFFGYEDKRQLKKALDGLKEAEVAAKASDNLLERPKIRSYIMEILALIEDGRNQNISNCILRGKPAANRGG
jgi:hypothetical protein